MANLQHVSQTIRFLDYFDKRTHQLRFRASGPPGFRGGGCWPPGPPRSSLWPYVVARAETVVLKGAMAEREAKAGRRAVRKRAVDDLADMVMNL